MYYNEYIEDIAVNLLRDTEYRILEAFDRRLNLEVIDLSFNIEALKPNIESFSLDYNKFYYLCAFLKDYIDSLTVEQSQSTKEILDSFHNLIELSFKTKDKKVTVTNKRVLELIERAVNMIDNKEEDRPIISFSNGNLSSTNKIHLFYTYLHYILSPLKAKDNTISKDKSFLISQLIYYVGLSNNKSFLEEYNDNGYKKNYLRSYISKCKTKENYSSNAYQVITLLHFTLHSLSRKVLYTEIKHLTFAA